ncbi:MAG: hypothetical protein IPI28_05920 [Candidatus Omnitrophica bacterium]|nr:hypothetical protein [Candidatus Omnitrophota bacterium]
MAIYPLGEVSLSSSKTDLQTALDTLKGTEEAGFDKFGGFTWIWLSAIYSRLGVFPRAIQCLEEFIQRFTRPNGLNSHHPKDSDKAMIFSRWMPILDFPQRCARCSCNGTRGYCAYFPGWERIRMLSSGDGAHLEGTW